MKQRSFKSTIAFVLMTIWNLITAILLIIFSPIIALIEQTKTFVRKFKNNLQYYFWSRIKNIEISSGNSMDPTIKNATIILVDEINKFAKDVLRLNESKWYTSDIEELMEIIQEQIDKSKVCKDFRSIKLQYLSQKDFNTYRFYLDFTPKK